MPLHTIRSNTRKASYYNTIEFTNIVEVLYYATPSFLSWLVGLILSIIVLSQFFYIKRWVKNVASHCSVMKDDSAHDILSLSNMSEENFQLKLWWRKKYHGLYYGITMDRAIVLYGKGLCFFEDIWDPRKLDLLVREEAKNKFSIAAIIVIFESSYCTSMIVSAWRY